MLLLLLLLLLEGFVIEPVGDVGLRPPELRPQRLGGPFRGLKRLGNSGRTNRRRKLIRPATCTAPNPAKPRRTVVMQLDAVAIAKRDDHPKGCVVHSTSSVLFMYTFVSLHDFFPHSGSDPPREPPKDKEK